MQKSEKSSLVDLIGVLKVASGGHKRKDPTPEIVDHCAARLVKEKGIPKDQAYAICVGRFQDYGILKKHSMELTEKGRRMSQKHYKHRRAIDLHKIGAAPEFIRPLGMPIEPFAKGTLAPTKLNIVRLVEKYNIFKKHGRRSTMLRVANLFKKLFRR